MARVLFFLQLILALVVLPLWPGLSPVYALWGAVYLVVTLGIPPAAALAVHGARATGRALADAWSPVPLGPQAAFSVRIWDLMASVFPVGGLLGALAGLTGALLSFDPAGPFPVQVGIALLFCLVWGLVGLLLARILGRVVVELAARAPKPLVTLSSALGARFGLTPREVEAAQAILDGLTYQGAGERLGIAVATVKSHVLNVYQKTGAGNKIELLRWVEAESSRLHQKVDGLPESLGRG
jgi:DNA-binding CsgD family transcriptional regulator